LLEAFDDLIPREIVHRKKMGFGVPLDHWFRGPLAPFAQEVFTDRRTRQRGLFQNETVDRLLDEHIAGRFDHAPRLWALLILELWQREWLDG